MTTGRVLVLGADGFIGRHIVIALQRAGYDVCGCARSTDWLSAMCIDNLAVDLEAQPAQTPGFWRDKLTTVTHLVNAAGLLDASEDTLTAVHRNAPAALYGAAPHLKAGVLISAVGIDADTPFARARRNGEVAALKAPFPITILRPGLVIGTTSYGGTSLGRAMAAAPWRIPVIGTGTQPLNPLHAQDLAEIVIEFLIDPRSDTPLTVGGPETLSQTDYLAALRRWMGLRPEKRLHLPVPFGLALGRLGEVMRLGPITRASVRQLLHGVEAPIDPSIRHAPMPFSQVLATTPAGTQDLWHARLYLIRPLIRLALIFLWLASGLLGLLLAHGTFLPLLDSSGLSERVAIALARLGGLIDLAIAFALSFGWRLRLMARVQIGVILAYSLGLTILAPNLWLDPIGGLLKNIPILALILVHRTLEQER